MRAWFRALAVTKPIPRALGRPGPVRGGAKGSAAFVAHALGSGARARDGDLEPSRRRSRRYGLGPSGRGGLSEGGVRAFPRRCRGRGSQGKSGRSSQGSTGCGRTARLTDSGRGTGRASWVHGVPPP